MLGALHCLTGSRSLSESPPFASPTPCLSSERTHKELVGLPKDVGRDRWNSDFKVTVVRVQFSTHWKTYPLQRVRDAKLLADTVLHGETMAGRELHSEIWDVFGPLMCGPERTSLYKQCLVSINNPIFKQGSGRAGCFLLLLLFPFFFLRLTHTFRSRRHFLSRPLLVPSPHAIERQELLTSGLACLSRRRGVFLSLSRSL